MSTTTYRLGAELPNFAIEWRDRNNNLIAFSSGWTFTFKLFALDTNAAVYTLTSGILGAATTPNVTVNFPVGAFASMTPGTYGVYLRAHQTSSGYDRDFPPLDSAPCFMQLVAELT